MILTMDHGVMASIFSALALPYLFDFDDALVRSLDAVGFRRSRLAATLIRPIARAFVAAGLAADPGAAPPRDGGAAGLMRRAAELAEPMREPGPWAVGLCLGLCVYHLSEAYPAITDDRRAAHLFKEFDDYRVGKLAVAVAAASAAAALARDGPANIAGAVQVLACLGWVYVVTRWAVWIVLLAWARRGSPADLGWHFYDGVLNLDRDVAVPLFAVHVALAALRPLPVLWLAVRRRRRLAAAAGGGVAAAPGDMEKNL
jgi:hypothetical protein